MTRYYEDLEVGEIIEFGSYTMERDEMLEFARKWDPRPFHVDEDFAKQSIFGGLTASGVQTVAVLTRLSNEVTGTWQNTGALGYDKLRFPTAVKAGDTLKGRSEILEKRVSKSRPELGIVRSRETLTNQRGELALEFEVAVLMKRRNPEG